MNYGEEESDILKALKPTTGDYEMKDAELSESPLYKQRQAATTLAVRTHAIVFRRSDDPNVLPYVHCTLLFLFYLSPNSDAMSYIAPGFAWNLLVVFLNTFLSGFSEHSLIKAD